MRKNTEIVKFFKGQKPIQICKEDINFVNSNPNANPNND